MYCTCTLYYLDGRAAHGSYGRMKGVVAQLRLGRVDRVHLKEIGQPRLPKS